MDNREISKRMADLAKKWQEGTITPTEKREFDEWYSSFDDSVLELHQDDDAELIKERIFYSINKQISPREIKKPTSQTTFFRIAAAVLIFLTSALLYLDHSSDNNSDATINSKANDIPPGGQKAILVLSNGSKVMLDGKSDGPLKIEGAEINRKKGQLIYASKHGIDNVTEPVYHTIKVPQGGTYQLDLPDGTRVWLNAASSLRYPVEFKSTSREVELTGEAYFEVSKDKKRPFIVKSEKLSVEVLGTHFNVNAYEDEDKIKTTLFEGKVRIHQADNNVILEPMQQATLNTANQALKIKNINSKEDIAWKDGEFIFDNESITSVMRKISRWYDVEVVYKGRVPEYRYIGKISRYENVSEVLKMLSLTKTIHFEIKERRIIVML